MPFYLVAIMDLVTLRSNATVIKAGLDYFALKVGKKPKNVWSSSKNRFNHLLFSYTAICKEGCHSVRGFCQVPGECRYIFIINSLERKNSLTSDISVMKCFFFLDVG